MAVFNGTAGNDTYAGTGTNDTIRNGGGKDTLAGADGDDTFIIDAQPANGTILDGGIGTDTLWFENFPDAPLAPVGWPATSVNLFNVSALSFERIVFGSGANTSLAAVFSFAGTGNQFTAGGISPTVAIEGGAGVDALVLSALNIPGPTLDAPSFSYTNWTTPARPWGPGDRVMLVASGDGLVLNGSAHPGLQVLDATGINPTINGSADMDVIRLRGANQSAPGGTYQGQGGDDGFSMIDTVTTTYGPDGSITSQTHSGQQFSGLIDGGSGTDFLILGGKVDPLISVRNVEGIYLSPESGAVMPNGTRQGQEATEVVLSSGWLEAMMPANMIIAGSGTIHVTMYALADGSGYVTADQGFDAAGFRFEPDADVSLVIQGSPLDDLIVGSKGNDTIDGGAGHNTMALAGTHAQYGVMMGSNGILQFNGPDGSDAVSRVDVFRFTDGDFVWSRVDNSLVPVGTASQGGGFRLYASPGFVGEIGGIGTLSLIHI